MLLMERNGIFVMERFNTDDYLWYGYGYGWKSSVCNINEMVWLWLWLETHLYYSDTQVSIC
jgi:hypothetical protein